jgi:hypothetical protein
MRHLPLLLLLPLLGLAACKKIENEIPVLSVSPSDRDIDATSGQVLSFTIRGRSDGRSLSRLVITSKKDNSFTVTVKDSALAGSNLDFVWETRVANAIQPYSEVLTFQLIDSEGAEMRTTRTLYVTLGAIVLTETSGHQFYHGNSAVHGESAFDLETRVPVLASVDSTRRDVQDVPLSPSATEMSRTWRSPAGGRFVRFNEFDYANATDISLEAAFLAGVPSETISDVQVGDMILVRLGSLPDTQRFYAVMKIMDIIDEPGTADNDRYVFNMKWALFDN